jgi:feruloyl esterase
MKPASPRPNRCFSVAIGLHLSLLLAAALLPAAARGSSCDALAKLQLPHTTVTLAEAVPAGDFTPPTGSAAKPIANLPAFCRVAATLSPAPDSQIKVELWLPISGWNHRLEGTGNGGFAGNISYGSLAGGLRNGYATANTEMGMTTPPGQTAGIFIDRPERWTDWGWRATHEMTVFSKAMVAAFYAEPAKKSYFVGCSTGGQQALSEAQRFPDDYDGIVSGAPANNRTALHVAVLWNFVEPQKTPASYLPPAKVAVLAKAVLDACDALDGVKDGLVSDPEHCHFDPAVLACKAADAPNCLTAPQVETVRAIYAGPTDPRTGKSLYPGLAKGSEALWNGLSPAPANVKTAPFAPLFEWVFGPQWDWHTFDFGADMDAVNRKLAATLNATNPDLDAFRAHGHKLIAYHGWSDPLVPSYESVNYRNAVLQRDAAHHVSTLADSYRLFMVPGMAHCGGGTGPNSVDYLDALVAWVEQGLAPGSLIAHGNIATGTGEKHPAQRLLCPYPQTARLKPGGDPDLAASYTCADDAIGHKH